VIIAKLNQPSSLQEASRLDEDPSCWVVAMDPSEGDSAGFCLASSAHNLRYDEVRPRLSPAFPLSFLRRATGQDPILGKCASSLEAAACRCE
jgi:hypothetical protein